MKAVRLWRFSIFGFVGKPRELEVPLSFTFKIENPPKPAYLHLTDGKVVRADEVREFVDGVEYRVGHRAVMSQFESRDREANLWYSVTPAMRRADRVQHLLETGA
jgi:hypothetical protein